MKIFKFIVILAMFCVVAPSSHAQKSKADEAKDISNMLDLLGATLEGDKVKEEEAYNRLLREKAERDRLRQSQSRTPDQVLDELWQQSHSRETQSMAYQGHQSEMAAIMAAREARQQQTSANSVGFATNNSVTSRGAASGIGGGIEMPEDITLDDIGIASRGLPNPPVRYQGSPNARVPQGDCSEIFGFATSSCGHQRQPSSQSTHSGWKNPGEGPCHFTLRRNGGANTEACFAYVDAEVNKSCNNGSGSVNLKCQNRVMDRIYSKRR